MNNCAYTKLHTRHYVHNGLAPAKWDYHKLHQKHMKGSVAHVNDYHMRLLRFMFRKNQMQILLQNKNTNNKTLWWQMIMGILQVQTATKCLLQNKKTDYYKHVPNYQQAGHLNVDWLS